MAETMYNKMNELGIKICPRCGKEFTEHPALSRVDNKTEICAFCGIFEAIESFKAFKEMKGGAK